MRIEVKVIIHSDTDTKTADLHLKKTSTMSQEITEYNIKSGIHTNNLSQSFHVTLSTSETCGGRDIKLVDI